MAVNIPMVLISREMAKKELKDVPDGEARANKLGFVAGFMGGGFLPAIVVQQIAKRDAADLAVPPAAVVTPVVVSPPGQSPPPPGFVLLPDVVNSPLPDAQKALGKRGWPLPTPVAKAHAEANLVVVEQAPSGPTVVADDTRVLLGVAPRTVNLPDKLVGGTIDDALQKLTAASPDFVIKARRPTGNGTFEPAGGKDQVVEVYPDGGHILYNATVVVLAKAPAAPPAQGGGLK